MNARKTLSILLMLIVAICILTACVSNNGATHHLTETHTSTSSILESTTPITTTQPSTPITKIVEMNSTGQISFDLLGTNRFYSDILLNMNCDPLIPFKFSEKCGFVDENGNVVIDNIYDKVAPFSEGKAVVMQDKQIKIIDTTGKELFSFPLTNLSNNESISIYHYMYRDGILYFNANLIFDNNCKQITVNELKGRAYYRASWKNNSVYLMDYSGNKLVTMPFNSIQTCPYAKMKLSSDTTDTLLNKIFFANNGYANVCNESNKWGLYDLKNNTMVIDYQYDYVGMLSNDVIPISSYNKWGLIDLQGNTLIPCNKFKYIGPFNNEYAFAVDENEDTCIIDKNGNILYNVNLYATKDNYYVFPFSEKNNYTLIISNNKNYYCINNQGELLLQFDKTEYDYISDDYIVANDKLYKFVIE